MQVNISLCKHALEKHSSCQNQWLHINGKLLKLTEITSINPSLTTTSCRQYKWSTLLSFDVTYIMARRSFSELSKTAIIPLYCGIVLPHLENAMEANAPTLRADLNPLERVQRLASRVVRGLRHVSYEERRRQLNLFSLERRRLRADLILVFKIFKVDVDLPPPTPSLATRAHLPITARTKSPSVPFRLGSWNTGTDCRHI